MKTLALLEENAKLKEKVKEFEKLLQTFSKLSNLLILSKKFLIQRQKRRERLENSGSYISLIQYL